MERQTSSSSSSSRLAFLSGSRRFSKKREESPVCGEATTETPQNGEGTPVSRPPTASTGGSSEAVTPQAQNNAVRPAAALPSARKSLLSGEEGERAASLFALPSQGRQGSGAVVSQRIKDLLADVDTREALQT
ncbi:phosphoinositide phospholipase PIPLC, partial [Toxoplasma gondii MAS]